MSGPQKVVLMSKRNQSVSLRLLGFSFECEARLSQLTLPHSSVTLYFIFFVNRNIKEEILILFFLY